MIKKKLIFLDIDGVFNHHTWWDERESMGQDLQGDDWREVFEFDPKTVDIFNSIIRRTKAKIVVSSSWRKGDLQYLINLFNKVGIEGEVIGETPKLRWLCDKPSAYIPRGVEIKDYLASVHGYPVYDWDISGRVTDVETYVIIDDDSDMLLEQKDHFVQTSMREGLTIDHANEVVRILNGKSEHYFR